MPGITWLIGAHRSGTTLLRECLGTNSSIACLDEVFVQYREVEKNFFHYFLQLTSGNPDMSLPVAATREELYRKYVGFLETLYPMDTNLIADVKYSQTHHFDGINRRFYEKPELLNYARDRGDSFIHLIRTNVLQSYVSALVARKNQSYRVRSKSELKNDRVQLDCSTLAQLLHYRMEEIQLFQGWLYEHTAVITCFYEDLLDSDGNISADLLDNIARLCGCPVSFDRTPKRQKLGGDLSYTILNFDEVRDCLARTDYEWMLN